MKRRRAAPLGGTNNRGSAGVRSRGEVSISATNRAGVLRDLGPYNALGRAGAPTLARSSLCPGPMPQGRLMYTKATDLPNLYIRNIIPTDMKIPLLGYRALSGWGEAAFLYLRGRRILGSLRLTSGGGIMIIRWKGMRPPLAKARKEGGHARRSAIINVKHAPRTSKEESDRKEERRL